MTDRRDSTARGSAPWVHPSIVVRMGPILDPGGLQEQALSGALASDPGASAAVLEDCCAQEGETGQSCGSVEEAIRRHGAQAVADLGMRHGVDALLGGPQPAYDLAPGDLRDHASACGAACRLLTRRLRFGSEDLIYIAGLLHDLGKAFLDPALRSRSQEIRRRTEAGRTFQEAERELLGVDHAELGARVLEQWSYPDLLVRIIRHHHEPERSSEEADLCALLHVADALSHGVGARRNRPGLASRFSPSAVRRLRLDAADLDELQIALAIELVRDTTARAA